MAKQQKVTIEYTDDVSGDSLVADEVRTVEFALDGSSYEIDLSADNAAKLRDELATWIGHARKVTANKRVAKVASAPRAGRASVDREQNQAVREWARSQGHEISDRGRISSKIMAAYQAAH